MPVGKLQEKNMKKYENMKKLDSYLLVRGTDPPYADPDQHKMSRIPSTGARYLIEFGIAVLVSNHRSDSAQNEFEGLDADGCL